MNKQVKCMDCGTVQYQDDGIHEFGDGYEHQLCVFCDGVIMDYLFGMIYCIVINEFKGETNG